LQTVTSLGFALPMVIKAVKDLGIALTTGFSAFNVAAVAIGAVVSAIQIFKSVREDAKQAAIKSSQEEIEE